MIRNNVYVTVYLGKGRSYRDVYTYDRKYALTILGVKRMVKKNVTIYKIDSFKI